MAEQLALDQVARDCRHVDRHERPVLAQAEIMQRARTSSLPVPLSPLIITRDRCSSAARGCDNLLHRRTAPIRRQDLLSSRAPSSSGAGRDGLLVQRARQPDPAPPGQRVLADTRRPRPRRHGSAVITVFCADITITAGPADRLRIAGIRSSRSVRASSSVTTTSPSPSSIQRHRVGPSQWCGNRPGSAPGQPERCGWSGRRPRSGIVPKPLNLRLAPDRQPTR